jgi:shikimate kinase
MHLVMLFGPPAVGKMTVGREIARRTGYKLFHNHMSIDPILDVFEWGTPAFTRLTKLIRRQVIAEAVAADLRGLIFTFVWNLDDPADHAYVAHLVEPAETAGARIDFVELRADQPTRLGREGTPSRLEHKRYKRDIEWARALLVETDAAHRVTSRPGERIGPWPHVVIDNDGDDPAVPADAVIEALGLLRSVDRRDPSLGEADPPEDALSPDDE